MHRYLLASLLYLPASLLAQTPRRADPPDNATGAAAKETWKADTSASEVGFNLRLFAGRSEGRFDVWSATVTMPADKPGAAPTPSDRWNQAAVDVVVQTASVHTDEEDRDKHLRNEDFFDVEKYPTLAFKSTSVKRTGDSLSIAGNLTIKKVTKPVVLKGKFTGGTGGTKPRMTFEATTTINRLDYGVNYENILVRDGIVLGEDVTIAIKLALVPQ